LCQLCNTPYHIARFYSIERISTCETCGSTEDETEKKIFDDDLYYYHPHGNREY